MRVGVFKVVSRTIDDVAEWYLADPDIWPVESIAVNDRGEPYFRRETHALQVVNQLMLWQCVKDSGLEVPTGEVFDVGGGKFFALPFFARKVFPEIGIRPISMVDLSEARSNEARDMATRYAEAYRLSTISNTNPEGKRLEWFVEYPQNLAELDPNNIKISEEHIPVTRRDPVSKAKVPVTTRDPASGLEIIATKLVVKTRPRPKYAFEWSNTVWHWLEDYEKRLALRNLYRMAKRGTILGMSVSAPGSGGLLLQAFNNVLDRVDKVDELRNPNGYYPEYREINPIGSIALGDILPIIESSGFKAVFRQEIPTRIYWQHPDEYFNAVRHYGRRRFEKCFAHLSQADRSELWERIRREHQALARKAGWSSTRPFAYEQHDNYIVAVPLIPEPINIRVLTEEGINKRFAYLLAMGALTDPKDISIKVSGNHDALKDTGTTVGLRQLLGNVIAYAARKWDYSGDQRTMNLRFSRPNKDTLLLKVDIAIRDMEPPNQLFEPSAYTLLRAEGLTMHGVKLPSNLVRYEFNLPLYPMASSPSSN